MSYTDLRDFVAEYMIVTGDGLTIHIEKLGGGTVDKAYTGTWRYVVKNANGIEVGRGQDVETGMPHTHAYVASLVAERFEPSGTWEIGRNLIGSPRTAAATFDTWTEAADAVRELAREYADTDDESRDDDDESTAALVSAMLASADGVGPERSEESAWAMWIEDSSYHRVEFWIQPKTSW